MVSVGAGFSRPGCRDTLKDRHLSLRQIAELAWTYVLVVDGPDTNATEADDLMADRFAHAANLAVAPFVDHDRQQRVLARRDLDRLDDLDAGWSGLPAVQHHPALQAAKRVAVGNPADTDVVFPLDAVARMHQPLGQIAVTREKQETFGVVIQPSHGIDVVAHAAGREQVDDGWTLLRIRTAGDVAARFVHQDVATSGCGFDAAAVDADVVGIRIRFRAELGFGPAVHRDAAIADEDFGSAAGRDACCREDLLKARRRHVSSVLVAP